MRLVFLSYMKGILNAYVIRINDVMLSQVSDRRIKFSKEQTAKVVGWSRDLFNKRDLSNNAWRYSLEKSLADTALLELVRLGDLYVSMSEEDLNYCLCHDNKRIRHMVCWRFDLLEHHIDMVLAAKHAENGYVITMPGIIIDRYAKSLTPVQIEKIQLTCNMDDCCSLWFAGIGDSPIKVQPNVTKDIFIDTCDSEMFSAWQASYRARIESEKLKRLSFVSELGEVGKDNVMPRRQAAL